MTSTKMATATKNTQNNKTKNTPNKNSKPKTSQNNNNKAKQVQANKPKAKTKGSQHSNLLRNVTIVLALLGIGVSVFALYVEIRKENDPNYVALCDISSYISCSKVLTSRYSKGFGLIDQVLPKDHILNQPNPVYGIIFYLLLSLLALKATTAIAVAQAVLSILANIGSIYLGYILIFILGDVCLVCITTYVINFILLVTSLVKLWQTAATTTKSSKKKK